MPRLRELSATQLKLQKQFAESNLVVGGRVAAVNEVAFSEQFVPETAISIGSLVDAAVLQFRHDEIDEIEQVLWFARSLDVEAVDLGFLHPGNESVRDLAGRAHDETFAASLRSETSVILQAFKGLLFLEEVFGDRADALGFLPPLDEGRQVLRKIDSR
jgi:hypothetical protein